MAGSVVNLKCFGKKCLFLLLLPTWIKLDTAPAPSKRHFSTPS